jgi:hypothetical protein
MFSAPLRIRKQGISCCTCTGSVVITLSHVVQQEDQPQGVPNCVLNVCPLLHSVFVRVCVCVCARARSRVVRTKYSVISLSLPQVSLQLEPCLLLGVVTTKTTKHVCLPSTLG